MWHGTWKNSDVCGDCRYHFTKGFPEGSYIERGGVSIEKKYFELSNSKNTVTSN